VTSQEPGCEKKREDEKAGGREPVSQKPASCSRPRASWLNVERVGVVKLVRNGGADADGESASCRSLVNAQSRRSITSVPTSSDWATACASVHCPQFHQTPWVNSGFPVRVRGELRHRHRLDRSCPPGSRVYFVRCKRQVRIARCCRVGAAGRIVTAATQLLAVFLRPAGKPQQAPSHSAWRGKARPGTGTRSA
jgi:hypothetical protein